LGAEAAKALDRFDRVARHLQDNRKALENDIVVRDNRRAQSAARLHELRGIPRESDQLFVDLLRYLDSVGWRSRPTAKGEANNVSVLLQTAIVNLGVLRSQALRASGMSWRAIAHQLGVGIATLCRAVSEATLKTS
jgi:hypothetical protein